MSDYRNLADVAHQLRAAGLVLETVRKASGGVQVGEVYVESTRSVRCDVEGSRKRGTGAYSLHELRLKDGIWLTGAYWTDHGGGNGKIELRKECGKCGADIPLKSETCPACGATRFKAREIPAEEMEAHKRRMAELRRQAEAEEKRAANRAAAWADAVWLACSEVADPAEHDYLVRKRLKSAHGARLFSGLDGVVLEGAEKEDYQYLGRFVGALVVPLCDEMGRRRGLQFVLSRERHKDLISKRDDRRDKDNWPAGMQAEGLHYVIGGAVHGLALVAEGFATAASLAEATGLPAVMAISANNLIKVGERLWKSRKRKLHLLYCADDDWLHPCRACKKYTQVASDLCEHCGQQHGKANAGVNAAKVAAAATSGAWLKPEFSAPRPTDRKSLNDFNDLACAEGLHTVSAQVGARLADLGWGGAAPPPARETLTQGGGDGERPNPVSILGLDAVVERFLFVDDSTGEYAFDTWTRDLVKLSKVKGLLPARVRFDDVKDHPAWRKRAVYLDQIGFDPSGEDAGIACNRWTGWPTHPQKGSCERQLELLRYLCSNEPKSDAVYHWVLSWMAWPLQHPGAKLRSALVFHGPQGAGKGMVFESYARIYAKHGVTIGQGAIEDKFNPDWTDKILFVFADEIVARSEMHHLKNQLKTLITGDWIRVNPKGIAAYRERNRLNVVFASNEDQPVVLENDDRRHLVIWTPPKLTPDFYVEVQEEVENGGWEALFDYLLRWDTGNWRPWQTPPMTRAKEELIAVSADSIERFLIDWQDGSIDGLPFCPCASSDLYAVYLRWCKRNGENFPRNSAQFGSRIGKRSGWQKTHKDRLENLRMERRVRQRFILPSPEAMASAVRNGMQDFRRLDTESETEWASRCFFAFREAAGLGE